MAHRYRTGSMANDGREALDAYRCLWDAGIYRPSLTALGQDLLHRGWWCRQDHLQDSSRVSLRIASIFPQCQEIRGMKYCSQTVEFYRQSWERDSVYLSAFAITLMAGLQAVTDFSRFHPPWLQKSRLSLAFVRFIYLDCRRPGDLWQFSNISRPWLQTSHACCAWARWQITGVCAQFCRFGEWLSKMVCERIL